MGKPEEASQGSEVNKSGADDSNTTYNNYDAEGADYDPFAERRVTHPTSDAGALAHLLKCSLGSGILAMPNAIRNGGLVFGAIFTVLVGLLCTHCVHILVKSSHIVCKKAKKPSLTFAETGEQAFATGPQSFRKFAGFAKGFTNGALIATYYGALAVYIVFVAESLKRVVDTNVECDKQLDIRIWIAMLFVPLSLLCLIRNLKYLVPFSWLANCFIIVGFALTLYYIFTNLGDPKDLPKVGEVGNLPLFFSTVIFAMEGIGVVMPVENSMKNPSRFLGCPGILNIAMSIVVSLYAVIGVAGYIAFQNGTQASITFNLPENDIMTQIVQICVGLAIMFTYPLQFYVATEIILNILKTKIAKNKFSMFQNFYRVIVVAITVGIAAAVPNLGPIISLVGAVCFSILGLLVPAAIEIAACYDGMLGRWNWILIKDVIIIILALLALVSGSYTSILEIIDEYSNPEESTTGCNGQTT
ncbi:Proton-coupled amino acid transporter-like protein pathetic [Gryllus bimaculatus]|nr:Proton-coupled amino acid transporter-like protein pathetic [Gryllus bimaculatus]